MNNSLWWQIFAKSFLGYQNMLIDISFCVCIRVFWFVNYAVPIGIRFTSFPICFIVTTDKSCVCYAATTTLA